MSKRPYTGNKDGEAKGLRPGMKVFIDETIKLSNGALWNNGDFGVRMMRGSETSMSVHATGRAVDLSFRHMPPKKGIKNGRIEALRVLKIIVANADALGVEAIFDYIVKPHGRAWMCDRNAWLNYKKETIHGGGSGDWLHFEVSPAMADNASKMKEAFANLVIPSPDAQEETPTPA
jgi:hypothetical protein